MSCWMLFNILKNVAVTFSMDLYLIYKFVPLASIWHQVNIKNALVEMKNNGWFRKQIYK